MREELINKIQAHYFIKYGAKPDVQDAHFLDESLTTYRAQVLEEGYQKGYLEGNKDGLENVFITDAIKGTVGRGIKHPTN